MDVSIIVPCFNEEDNVLKIKDELLPVVEQLYSHRSVEVIFVDDGSSDGTLSALQANFGSIKLNNGTIKFTRHQKNLGLGAAIRTGFNNSEGDYIITTDSDGTYKFTNIPLILDFLQTKNVDIVTASPYHPQGHVEGVPQHRLILSKGSSFIYRLLVNWHIYTYTCLFRCYRKEVIQNIHFKSNGFLAGTELLVKSMLANYKVAEFPAVLYSRSYGTSKAKLARTIMAHLEFQSKVLLHRAKIINLVGA
jgi:dolichol-phosphate mannosyltransferase